MEKKELLGVRDRLLPRKRPRRVAVVAAGGGGGGLAKAIAAYLASDSYMYAPLVSDPQMSTPPAAVPSAAPAAGSPEKEVTLVQNTEALGEVPLLPARSSCGHVVGVIGVVAHKF